MRVNNPTKSSAVPIKMRESIIVNQGFPNFIIRDSLIGEQVHKDLVDAKRRLGLGLSWGLRLLHRRSCR
jgi:hypothetical protein